MANRRFRDDDPRRVLHKIVGTVDDTRQTVHEHPFALGRNNIENDCPALAVQVIRPIIVSDHNFAVFRITPGGNKRTAMLGNRLRSGGLDSVCPVVFLDVVLPFLSGIQSHHIPQIDPHSMLHALGIDAIGDALQLLPVLLLNVRPHHVLRGVPEELPVFLTVVCLFEYCDF